MPNAPAPPSLAEVAREWTRIGTVGFGGPPAHVALFRALCVERRGWLTAEEFEDAVVATSLLPGPGSTQLGIFCGWRVRGIAGALVGGAGFVLPGLLAILALAALFLAGDPPRWVRGAGAGAGAAVAAVAVQAALGLAVPGWARTARNERARWIAYLLAGALAAATLDALVVLVLVGCGALEVAIRRTGTGTGTGSGDGRVAGHAGPLLLALAAASGGTLALVWTALKVGALSYGGGFVIVPLMQADAVDHHHWMTAGQFANAVALGQVTPGPVVHTVAVVGYAAAGLGGALLAAAVAFAPSFAIVLVGADRFDRLRADARVRAFLGGAGPAAIGAIAGSAIPLARALSEPWQAGVLAVAAVALLRGRLGVVAVLVAAGAAGAAAALAGASLPG